MEIIVDNVRFNISAEDLETAEADFSFWKGRRFSFVSKDIEEHFLRYNDIMQAVLAEDATFTEDKDRQRIYKALNNLKERGYPHEESCGTSWMLWLKQLFGNIFRQSLVDQLNSKLPEEGIEELSTSEDDEQALIFPFCQEPELLGTLCKYASRNVFTLAATCKLFKEYIKENPICKRDFRLLKEIFNLAQGGKWDLNTRRDRPEIEPTEMTTTESKCIRLVAEFLPKEAYKITPPKKFYYQSDDYVRHQQKLAIVLAGIDLSSALKVVASMNPEMYPVQTFCAVAAIYEKNPSLCDEEKIFAMAEDAFSNSNVLRRTNFSDGGPGSTCSLLTTIDLRYYVQLAELCEAFIKINFPYAKEILKEFEKEKIPFLLPPQSREIYVQSLLGLTKRVGIAQLKQMGLDEDLLYLLVSALKHSYNFSDQILQGLMILDPETAVNKVDWVLENPKKLAIQNKVKMLIVIAEFYAEGNQAKSLETTNDALKELEVFYKEKFLNPNSFLKYDSYHQNVSHSLFGSIRRIMQILLINNRKLATQTFEKLAGQMRLLDDRIISELKKDLLLNFRDFPSELFMGALEVHPQKATEMVNAAVEWAKTIPPETPEYSKYCADSREYDEDLLNLSQILATHYPDQALEVANMIKLDDYKLTALLNIVSKGSSLPDID